MAVVRFQSVAIQQGVYLKIHQNTDDRLDLILDAQH